MSATPITKEILIEDLVNDYAFSVKYLMEHGIRCIMCGEPIWGTLEEAAKEKDFSDTEIEEVVKEMNKLAQAEQKQETKPGIIDTKKL